MPQKPWPPDVIVRPLKWTSMSSQRLKAPAISPRGVGVGFGEVAERLVREDNAPAERVVRPIALDDADRVARVRLFQQQRQVKPGRAAADAQDPHVHARRPSARRVLLRQNSLDLKYCMSSGRRAVTRQTAA